MPSLGTVCGKNSEPEVLSVRHVSLASMCKLLLENNAVENRSALIMCGRQPMAHCSQGPGDVRKAVGTTSDSYRLRSYINLEHPREFDCRAIEPCLFTDLTKSKGQKSPKKYVLGFYVIKESEYFVSL